MTEEFIYDVFISYSPKDKAVVHPLAERFKADGLKVWLDDWVLKPRAKRGVEIERGLKASRVLLMCMSKAYFASEWTKFEHHTLLFRDPTNEERRFVPVLLEECEPPDVIAQFEFVDWRAGDDVAYQKLLDSSIRSLESDDAVQKSEGKSAKTGTKKNLIATLEGHTGFVQAIVINLYRNQIISGSGDCSIKIWDLDKRHLISTFTGHKYPIRSIAVSPDGKKIISASSDQTIKIWDLDKHNLIATLKEHKSAVHGVAISLDGRRAVSGSEDGTLKIWDLEGQCSTATLKAGQAGVFRVVITPDGRRAISGSNDGTVKVWDLEEQRLICNLCGHSRGVFGLAIGTDGRRVISASSDQTIKIWDLDKENLIATLEGHSEGVFGLAISADGRRVTSVSSDCVLKVWDIEDLRLIGTVDGPWGAFLGVVMMPDGQQAITGTQQGPLAIWDLASLEKAAPSTNTTRYTNAKVVLVGESGVGKSGLALRLADDDWQETGSTHGMSVSKLDLPGVSDTKIEREIWLWDFAGQPDYRLVHQLYMDETALALMVIDPQKDDPFAPLGHWEQALASAVKHDPAKLLVAARCDRGGYIVPQKDIETYLSGRNYAGHVNTSAKLKDDPGCAELRTLIAENIPWDRLPSTSTTKLFKALKDAVIEVKESGIVLIRVVELEQRLRLGWNGEPFEERDLRTVVGLLAGQGIIKMLDFGDFVLLQPEQINNYGSAVVRTARDAKNELAELPEAAVLNGEIDFKDMKRLGGEDEEILLRAMVQTFLDRGLCYRIEPDGGHRLVFPAYFKHDRPEIPKQPDVVVTYGFTGPVDQIYTTLVVRLHYTNDFEIDHLWRYAADFNSLGGGRAGLMLTKDRDEAGAIRDDAATIKVYFDGKASIDTKVSFIKYIHEHLKREASEVTRIRDYVCPHCNTPVENKKSVAKKLSEGKEDIICVECEERVPLIDLIEEKFASDEFLQNVRKMDQQAQIRLDNESLELILVGHAFSTAGEAGHIFRPTPNSDWGIDGEIEFKNEKGDASGQRLYLQLKSGDSYLRHRKRDDTEIFDIKNPRHGEYWISQNYPVMLVIRGSDEKIRWMNVTDYLKQHGPDTKQITFDGEPFTAINVHHKWQQMMKVGA